MAAKANYVAIPRSERVKVPGATLLGPAHPNERLEVSVHVRRRSPKTGMPIAPSKNLTHKELEDLYGADSNDLMAVAEFARQHGLAVVESNAAKRLVRLSGTVSAFNDAFDVDLGQYQHARFTYRGRTGPISIPRRLAGIVTAVLGLDNRPFARPHFVKRKKPAGESIAAAAAGPPFFGLRPGDIATLYNFPDGDGAGQSAGIIELGGGFRLDDLNTYFADLGITPSPAVVAIPVDLAANDPGPLSNPNLANTEVMLDIEVIGAIVPKAAIAVYFAPNTDASFSDALYAAVHDTANNPSVISISWGSPEDNATGQFLDAFKSALEDAQSLNITVLAASGDNGAADMTPGGQFPWDGEAHVDFPASSPLVLACGATHIDPSGSTLTGESAWNNPDLADNTFGAVGGGISDVFNPPPSWQAGVTLPPAVGGGPAGRGVPDVTGNGDPASGYTVRVDGASYVVGGTSAVAPLWASLIIRINQILGHRVGFINAFLYANPGAFNDVTLGNNRVTNPGGVENLGYDADSGWDACTGLGSPKGDAILEALREATS